MNNIDPKNKSKQLPIMYRYCIIISILLFLGTLLYNQFKRYKFISKSLK